MEQRKPMAMHHRRNSPTGAVNPFTGRGLPANSPYREGAGSSHVHGSPNVGGMAKKALLLVLGFAVLFYVVMSGVEDAEYPPPKSAAGAKTDSGAAKKLEESQVGGAGGSRGLDAGSQGSSFGAADSVEAGGSSFGSDQFGDMDQDRFRPPSGDMSVDRFGFGARDSNRSNDGGDGSKDEASKDLGFEDPEGDRSGDGKPNDGGDGGGSSDGRDGFAKGGDGFFNEHPDYDPEESRFDNDKGDVQKGSEDNSMDADKGGFGGMSGDGGNSGLSGEGAAPPSQDEASNDWGKGLRGGVDGSPDAKALASGEGAFGSGLRGSPSKEKESGDQFLGLGVGDRSADEKAKEEDSMDKFVKGGHSMEDALMKETKKGDHVDSKDKDSAVDSVDKKPAKSDDGEGEDVFRHQDQLAIPRAAEDSEDAEKGSADLDKLEKKSEEESKKPALGDMTGESADKKIADVEDSSEGATEDTVKCEDDPDFLYKDRPGYDCDFIAKKTPERCDKLNPAGEKVGIANCPKSCHMVDECLAAKNAQASEKEVALAASDSVDQKPDVDVKDSPQAGAGDSPEAPLECEKDDTTFLYKDRPGYDCAFIAEKGPERCMKLVEGEMIGVKFCPKACKMETMCRAAKQRAEGGKTVDSFDVGAGKKAVEDSTDAADAAKESACEKDDPDFLYKDRPGYNCEFIAEKGPERCLKLHNGEKIGAVSCPKSCDMKDECLALKKAEGMEMTAIDEGLSETQKSIPEKETPVGQESDEEKSKAGPESMGDLLANEKIGSSDVKGIAEMEDSTDLEAKAPDDVASLCDKDDETFLYKERPGYDCAYITKDSLERCAKLNPDGDKIGAANCPKSCDMKEECMVLKRVPEAKSGDAPNDSGDKVEEYLKKNIEEVGEGLKKSDATEQSPDAKKGGSEEEASGSDKTIAELGSGGRPFGEVGAASDDVQKDLDSGDNASDKKDIAEMEASSDKEDVAKTGGSEDEASGSDKTIAELGSGGRPFGEVGAYMKKSDATQESGDVKKDLGSADKASTDQKDAEETLAKKSELSGDKVSVDGREADLKPAASDDLEEKRGSGDAEVKGSESGDLKKAVASDDEGAGDVKAAENPADDSEDSAGKDASSDQKETPEVKDSTDEKPADGSEDSTKQVEKDTPEVKESTDQEPAGGSEDSAKKDTQDSEDSAKLVASAKKSGGSVDEKKASGNTPADKESVDVDGDGKGSTDIVGEKGKSGDAAASANDSAEEKSADEALAKAADKGYAEEKKPADFKDSDAKGKEAGSKDPEAVKEKASTDTDEEPAKEAGGSKKKSNSEEAPADQKDGEKAGSADQEEGKAKSTDKKKSGKESEAQAKKGSADVTVEEAKSGEEDGGDKTTKKGFFGLRGKGKKPDDADKESGKLKADASTGSGDVAAKKSISEEAPVDQKEGENAGSADEEKGGDKTEASDKKKSGKESDHRGEKVTEETVEKAKPDDEESGEKKDKKGFLGKFGLGKGKKADDAVDESAKKKTDASKGSEDVAAKKGSGDVEKASQDDKDKDADASEKKTEEAESDKENSKEAKGVKSDDKEGDESGKKEPSKKGGGEKNKRGFLGKIARKKE